MCIVVYIIGNVLKVNLILNEDGMIVPVGEGECNIYLYNKNNMTTCHVKVIDDSNPMFTISTFFVSSSCKPSKIPQVLDYMVELGVDVIECTRSYDSAGNQICDYMMYQCAIRNLRYSV